MTSSIKSWVESQIPKNIPPEDLEVVKRCIHNYSCNNHIPYRVNQWVNSYPDWKRSVEALDKALEHEWNVKYPLYPSKPAQDMGGLVINFLFRTWDLFSRPRKDPEGKLKDLIKKNSIR